MNFHYQTGSYKNKSTKPVFKAWELRFWSHRSICKASRMDLFPELAANGYCTHIMYHPLLCCFEETPWPWQFIKGMVYLALQFKGDRSPSYQGSSRAGMVAGTEIMESSHLEPPAWSTEDKLEVAGSFSSQSPLLVKVC